MRWIIWWIRSWFCIHTFELEEMKFKLFDINGQYIADEIRISATCTKCGWHRSYNKYGL